ncbi:3'-5' exonuclease [Aquimarina mytili]|uniref:3'-5' exonuclease n=1 Tax=Aquimarina mytili TaxID=874423 RepID=A0A937A3Q5_9FLAO|nr:3'-5' exonuclease [Aquimarina mytili]MBL0683809.1 3'-5' exonuclease [Aquimarina mytili]
MKFWPKKNTENYPDFWKAYIQLFDKKPQKLGINDIRFIAFDTETTGFDYIDDRILSIGAVAIKNGSIDVVDQLEMYLDQEVFNEDTVEIHGIIKNSPYDKLPERKAIQLFITYIEDAVLIAHHAEFDRKMINRALQRFGLGKLKNKILDTGVLFKNSRHKVYANDSIKNYSLDELCNDLKIPKSDRHTASGDAFITGMAFLKILAKLKKDKSFDVDRLFRLA